VISSYQTNPAVGVHHEGRINLGLAQHPSDAAQDLFPGENRGWHGRFG
jgi:hypothetical protein